jgi:hypothetical protein
MVTVVPGADDAVSTGGFATLVKAHPDRNKSKHPAMSKSEAFSCAVMAENNFVNARILFTRAIAPLHDVFMMYLLG